VLKPVEQWKPARWDYTRLIYERTDETVYAEATCDEREYRLVVAALASMLPESELADVVALAVSMRSEPRSLMYRLIMVGDICREAGVAITPDPETHNIICDPLIAAYERERADHQESRS